MSKIKLNALLSNKKKGDTWVSIFAPEEYKVWTLEYKWDAEKFRKTGVKLQSVSVFAADSEKPTTVKFSSKEPLFLNCGVEIRKGQITTSAGKKGSFTLRIDGIIELNDALTELAENYNFGSFQVKKIEVYNPDEASVVLFDTHNPDGNGTNLSLWSIKKSKKETLYPEISYFDQQRHCKDFQDKFANCFMDVMKMPVHGCATQNKKKASGVKRRKKKS